MKKIILITLVFGGLLLGLGSCTIGWNKCKCNGTNIGKPESWGASNCSDACDKYYIKNGYKMAPEEKVAVTVFDD